MPVDPGFVRFRGYCGQDFLTLRITGFDPKPSFVPSTTQRRNPPQLRRPGACFPTLAFRHQRPTRQVPERHRRRSARRQGHWPHAIAAAAYDFSITAKVGGE